MTSSFWKKGTYYICVPQFGVLEIVCLFRVVKSGPKLSLIFGTASGTGIKIGSLLRTRFSESGSQFYLCVKWELEVEPLFFFGKRDLSIQPQKCVSCSPSNLSFNFNVSS